MNPTVTQFLIDFPEFSDNSTYPLSLITLWNTTAQNLVNADRWGTLTTVGQELATAHYLVLAARDQAAASVGIPGTPLGLQTAKSVGDVSASYDYSALLPADAGFWNQTTYGIRFYGLVRLMGAGGLQIWGC